MEVDLKIISNMISDMDYALFWLENGYERKRVRSISNMSYEQRTESWGDISAAVSYYNLTEGLWDKTEFGEEEADDDKKLEKYISCLTSREREAFTYIRLEGHSFAEAAKHMEMTRSTIQSYVKRSETKIRKQFDKSND